MEYSLPVRDGKSSDATISDARLTGETPLAEASAAPLGEVPTNLEIKLWVNGELRQSAKSSQRRNVATDLRTG